MSEEEEAEQQRRNFVVHNTLLRTVPGLTAIRLHLADEMVPIWEMTEEQLGVAGVDPPFWAFAWVGGQGVARYVLDHPETVAGQRVLDLAAGSGLAAIAALKAGAAAATVADVDPFALTAAQLNAEANGVSVQVTGEDLLTRDWSSGYDAVDADVILAGDVCYERVMAARMLRWLHGAADHGRLVLLGDPHRHYLDERGLVARARYQMPTIPDLEEADVKQVTVYQVSGTDSQHDAEGIPGTGRTHNAQRIHGAHSALGAVRADC